MKKFVLLIGVVLLIQITLVFAQEPISFRSKALGGIISDDLDLIYDPIELRFVKGIRIYTNLSNLSSGEEEILNNRSDNAFLLGSSWKYPFASQIWSALLIRFQNSRFSQPITIDKNLDGTPDILTEGELRDIFTEFLDNNQNGVYDIRRVIDQKKTNFLDQKNWGIIFNNSWYVSGTTLGLRFLINSISQDATNTSTPLGTRTGPLIGANRNDPSFQITHSSFNLEEGKKILDWNENGDFKNGNSHNLISLQFSAMKPFILPRFGRTETRFDFEIFREKSKINETDVYTGSYDLFIYTPEVYTDQYTESENYFTTTEREGNGANVQLSLKKVFRKSKERKNDGYWQIRSGFRFAKFDYNEETIHLFGGEKSSTDSSGHSLNFARKISKRTTDTDKGKENYWSVFGQAKVNLPLGKRVYVGGGAFFYYSHTSRNTSFENLLNNTTKFTSFDLNPADDFDRLETVNLNADHTFGFTDFSLQAPFGIEYKFTNNRKWSLRFGSIFVYTKTTTEDKIQVTQALPQKIQTWYADGRKEIKFLDNSYESTQKQIRKALSRTTFYYGLGFQATKNLQIDLLGFLGTYDNLQIIDSEFYRRLRISFSLRL